MAAAPTVEFDLNQIKPADGGVSPGEVEFDFSQVKPIPATSTAPVAPKYTGMEVAPKPAGAPPSVPGLTGPRPGETHTIQTNRGPIILQGPPDEGPIGLIRNTVQGGVEQIAGGLGRLAGPGGAPQTIRQRQSLGGLPEGPTGKDVAGGASDVIGGALKVATPAIPGAFVKAPLQTALALGLGSASQAATEAMLNAIDTPEEYSKLAGDIAGLVGGVFGAKAPEMVRTALFKRQLKAFLQDKINREYAGRQAAADAEAFARQPTVAPSTDLVPFRGQAVATTPKPPDNIIDLPYENVPGYKPRGVVEFDPADIQAAPAAKPPTAAPKATAPVQQATESAPRYTADHYSQALTIGEENGQISTSQIQRKLRLGYGAASSLIEQMDREGLLEPAEGSRPRKFKTAGSTLAKDVAPEKGPAPDSTPAPAPVSSPASAPPAAPGSSSKEVIQQPASESTERPGTLRGGSVTEMRPSEIEVDPARFQFKAKAIGRGGVSEELKGTEAFDPESAGVLSVWKDPANGKSYIVNGHHRLELAKRSGYDEPLLVQHLEAKDEKEARTIGALINIREGKGEATDAARVFRDANLSEDDLTKIGVSRNSLVAKNGLALSKLDDAVFEKVSRGDISEGKGAAIGDMLDNPAQQTAAADLLQRAEARGKRLTDQEFREAIRLTVQRAPVATQKTMSLFGEEESQRSLALELGEVSEYIKGALRSEKRLFGTVGSEGAAARLGETGNVIKADDNRARADQVAQITALYDKLSGSAGPVATALDTAAKELAGGVDGKQVKERAYDAVRRELEGTLSPLLGGGKAKTDSAVQEAGAGGRDQGTKRSESATAAASENPVREAGSRSLTKDQAIADAATKDLKFGGKSIDTGKAPMSESPLFDTRGKLDLAEPEPTKAAPVPHETPATSSKEAFKMSRPQLDVLAKQGDSGAIAELTRRGKPVPALLEPKHAPEQPAKIAPSGAAPVGRWMNEGEIDSAVEKFKKDSVLSRATSFLSDFREETNAHSDGWPYWKAPAHAALQLMSLIQHPEYATEENLRKAFGPIKSFYTTKGHAAGMKWPEISGIEAPKEQLSAPKREASPNDGPGFHRKGASAETGKMVLLADAQRLEAKTRGLANAIEGIPHNIGPTSVDLQKALDGAKEHLEKLTDAGDSYRKGLAKAIEAAEAKIAEARAASNPVEKQEVKAPNEQKTDIEVGDRVGWGFAGKYLTGKVLSIDAADGTARVEGHNRTDTVKLEKLNRSESNPPKVEQPVGATALADAIYDKLTKGESLGNVTELNKLAEKYFGASRTSGEYTPKDIFDAMEAGINKHLVDIGKDLYALPHDEALAKLRDLMSRVTTQGVRTDEQIAAQQFSTPPTQSFTVAKVAALRPDDVMLEPSAGNGGLAAWPKALGAATHVNEISDRRRAMLQHAGFGLPTAHDGEIINSLLDPSVKPTVILMNPPFSAGALKVGPAATNNKYGFNHVNSALQRLAPGGRLVAILGGGRANDPNGGASLTSGNSAKWFETLGKQYNVRANIRINGKEFQKYGTAFATRIIVIDKDGPTPSRVKGSPDWSSTVKANAETLEQAYTLLKDVADTRPISGRGVAASDQTVARQDVPGAIAEPAGGRGGGSGVGDVRRGAGTPGTSPVAGRGGSRGTATAPGVVAPNPAGKPTGVRQSGRGPVAPEQTAAAGSLETRPANADTERSLSNAPSDLAAAAGLSPEQIIAAAVARIQEATGRKPVELPKPEPPKATALSGAADAAKAALRAKYGKKPATDEPVRRSVNFSQSNAPVDQEDLTNLVTIGADAMLSGATDYAGWRTGLMNDIGELVEGIAKQAGQAVEDVLRQAHALAVGVAKAYGVDVAPAPPAQIELKAPTTGDGDNVPLDIEREAGEQPEVEDTEAYVEYRPSIKGAQHPGTVVETKTMATVPQPTLSYRPNLPKSIVDDGRLSAVQMEAVVMAGHQNNIVLPGGARSSAISGDGTGLGKGREAAAILWDNWRNGRKRLVWVSEKWDLMQDAMRDLEGLGAHELLEGNARKANGQFAVGTTSRVRPFSDWKAGDRIKHEGLMFSTYALIRSESKTGVRRAAQLEEYLRGDDDGEGAYLLMDEAHALKNSVVSDGSTASQIGVAVKDLLKNLPKLRTFSLSATAATDVMNLGYLDRLGLWGPGTAFPTGFGEFAAQIAAGRLAAMEMIARELKAQGKYLSRTLSFKGVQYEETIHEINPDQKAIYRAAATAWRSVVTQAESSIESTTNGGPRQKARFMANFAAAQQRFFGLLITALKTPTAVELANKGLADGKSVVITLVNTNEAAQNREKNRVGVVADEDEIPDYDFGPKQILVDLVREHFPVQQYSDDVDDSGNPIKVPVYRRDEEGREIPVNNPDAEKQRDALLKEIDEGLHMPENPLDSLINALGGDSKVAELTGRKEKYDSSTGKFITRGDPTATRKDINLFEMRAFQGGKKRVAVLSGAAATGISLHAGLDVANQQQRLHITLQVGWSADRQMQMFGRTHRTNQAQPPIYNMIVTDLGGERRFVSTIARRLGSLGAITKGQKNATTGTDLMEKVNFETLQGRQATRGFYENLLRNGPIPGTNLTGLQVLNDLRMLSGDPPTVPNAQRDNVTRLLNRLLALDPDHQNAAYNYFYDIFQAAVARAIEEGTLDTGVKTLPGESFKVAEARPIAKDPDTGAETIYYRIEANNKTDRLSVANLEKRMKNPAFKNPQLVRDDKGKIMLVVDAPPIVHASGTLENAVYTATPARGRFQKTAINKMRGFVEVNEWAENQVKEAEGRVKGEERTLGYSRTAVENALKSEGPRQQRLLEESITRNEQRLRNAFSAEAKRTIQQDIDTARAQLRTLPPSLTELPEDNWQRVRFEEDKKDLAKAKAELVEAQEINKEPEAWLKEQWAEQFDAAPAHVTEERHLIGGAVMRYWNPVHEESGFTDIYTTADSTTKQRVVGVNIPAGNIAKLLARISGGESTVTVRQIIVDVLRNGVTYDLEGGLTLRRGRVGKEQVIQVTAPNPAVVANLKSMGVISERGVVPILYVPNADEAGKVVSRAAILGKILEAYPAKPLGGGGPGGGQEPVRASRVIPGTYSQMARTLDQKMPNRATPKQVLGILANPQNSVKPDEIKWTGIEEWLKPKGDEPVDKAEVMDFVNSNEVKVTEVLHGTPDTKAIDKRIGEISSGRSADELRTARDPADQPELDRLMEEWDTRDRQVKPTKYGNYVTPGGTNYREVLLTLPVDQNAAHERRSQRVKELIAKRDQISAKMDAQRVRPASMLPEGWKIIAPPAKPDPQWGDLEKSWNVYDEADRLVTGGLTEKVSLTEAVRQYQERLRRDLRNTETQIDLAMKAKDVDPTAYRSSHWDEPNVLAHIRMDDRVGAGGERILHVNEVQSDWGQALRKNREGVTYTLREENGDPFEHYTTREAAERDQRIEADNGNNLTLHENRGKQLPPMPFEKTWAELSMKRVIRLASEGGYDALTWDVGATQADRYDLSKQVKEIQYQPVNNTDGSVDFLLNVIGLDGEPVALPQQAKKNSFSPQEVEEIVGKDVAQRMVDGSGDAVRGAKDWKSLSGVDLRVGGEGMSGFYDRILPQFANKYVKQWGAKVEKGEVPVRNFKEHTWEGPSYSLDQVEDVLEKSHAVRDNWVSPFTGERLMFPFTRVTVQQQLEKIVTGMRAGNSFEKAIERSALDHGTNVDDLFGGKTTSEYDYEGVPVHRLTITPAMRESVMQGQPLFMRGGNLNSTEPMKAAYRNGILWVNGATAQRIAGAYGVSQFNGLYVPKARARELLTKAADVPELARAVNDALETGHTLTIVRMDPGQSIAQSKAAARHELFHATEEWGGDARGNALLENPLAYRATVGLGAVGYDTSDIPIMFSEIGAHLASGPVGWKVLGLDEAEAKELFRDYSKLLADEQLDKLKRIAPLLKGELHAERSLRRATASDMGRRGSGEDDETAQGATGGQVRRSIRRDIPPGKEGERGSAPILGDLAQYLHDKFGDDEALANYSGLGALQTKFVRNLSQTAKRSPEVQKAAIRAAASRGQASAILRAAVPAIQRAMKGSEFTWDDLRLAMIESRLRGLRDRWLDFAVQASDMDDTELEKGFTSHFAGLLDAIQGKRNLPQDVAQTAAALYERKDWDTLREFLYDQFSDAADHVYQAMEPDWFEAVAADAKVHDGLQVYKKLVEEPMARNHALNEGVFSDALGPLETYYPLIPLDRDATKFGPGKARPYVKPKNQANKFATGLGEGYDASVAAFSDRLAGAIRANDKAALIQTLRDVGLLRPPTNVESQDRVFTDRGEDYKAESLDASDARTIIQNGKVVHVPAVKVIAPAWLARELRPILERKQIDTPTILDKIVGKTIAYALAGPADFVFHTSNLLGTLVANTPFLPGGAGSKLASVPIAKKFAVMYKIAITDPTTEEAARDIIDMANAGALPDKYASVTYSKQVAADIGAAKVGWYNMSPALFGPKGIDVRARLIMWRLAKELNPNATMQDLHAFTNQLGNYVTALQGEVERSLKSTGFSPFYTAGSTMIRNGLNAWAGTGPLPLPAADLPNTDQGWSRRAQSRLKWTLARQLTGGGIVMVALWMLTSKEITGKYPQDDKRSKFMMIPVPDSIRRSKLGILIWGNGPEVGYINFGYFNPLIMRGARAMGIPGAYDAKVAGGANWQAAEGAQRDIFNAWMHPIAGPIPRAAFVGASGSDLYMTGLRDRRGNMGPQFFPGIPRNTAPGWPRVGAQTFAALKQLNSFYGTAGSALGEQTGFMADDHAKKGNPWVRMLVDLTFPGLVGNATNPYARNAAMRQQKIAVESQQRRKH